MKVNLPQGKNTGPVRSKRQRPLPKGNPTRGGKVAGNWTNRKTQRMPKGGK